MPNIVLRRFMIFDSNEGQQEGREQDKVLYHWTKDAPNNRVDIVEQIDDICLCDASVNTAIRLDNTLYVPPTDSKQEVRDKRSQSGDPSLIEQNENELSRANELKSGRSLVLTFESTLVVMVEVEPELSIWMAVHVGLNSPAQETLSLAGSTIQQDSQSSSSQVSDLDCIPPLSIEIIVNNIYARFCLLNGTFEMIVDNIKKGNCGDETNCAQMSAMIREKIRTTCQKYFDNVLSEIHLNSMLTNLPSLYNFIVYLDLNPVTLMKVNSFVNHLVCLDAVKISHTIAIFNDQLLWSSMNMYDTRLVYNYLVAVLIRDALQEELSREMDKVRRIKENMLIHLTDVSNDINNIEGSISALSIEDGKKHWKKLSKFYLTVFRSSNNMTLGLILNEVDQFDLIQKCEHVLTSDTRMGVVPLASLAQSVGQNFLKSNSISAVGSSTQAQLNKRRQASNNGRIQAPIDHKYLCFDMLNVSALWSPNMESGLPIREQVLSSTNLDSSTSSELTKKNRKLKLTMYHLELESELENLRLQARGTGGFEEFLAKTTSDTWLAVMNSNYRCIYSIYVMRNIGLSEAHQYAHDLSKTLISTRRRY